MTDCYLSKDRDRLNRMQRERRASIVRIDYQPDADVLDWIEARRGSEWPECTNSGVLNAIVREWAELSGVNKTELVEPMTPSTKERHITPDDFGAAGGVFRHIARAYTRSVRKGLRVRCGAKRHRDGQPCQAWSEPGKQRCKWHGGCSTGPKTEEGKARALANLQKRPRSPISSPESTPTQSQPNEPV